MSAPEKSVCRRPASRAIAFVSAALLSAGCLAATTNLPLSLLQAELGWTTRVVRAECVEIGGDADRLRLFPGLRRAEINGLAVWLHAPCLPDGGRDFVLDAVDLERVLRPILLPDNSLPRPGLRVMLDPGHGGEDSGAATPDGRWTEKEFALDLALRTRMLLEEAGFAVACTREDDRFLDLHERTALAAAWGADVFVSLHANFAANGAASGRETYVLPAAGYPATIGRSANSARPCPGNSNDVANTRLGFCIHRRLPGRLHSADRGLRRARYQVLARAPCPAALIECGFLSNSDDAGLLTSGWYRDRLARAIADGIADYACPGGTAAPAHAPPPEAPPSAGTTNSSVAADGEAAAGPAGDMPPEVPAEEVATPEAEERNITAAPAGAAGATPQREEEEEEETPATEDATPATAPPGHTNGNRRSATAKEQTCTPRRQPD